MFLFFFLFGFIFECDDACLRGWVQCEDDDEWKIQKNEEKKYFYMWLVIKEIICDFKWNHTKPLILHVTL